MLFNSFVFLCLFLPVTYVVFWALRTASARYVWLTITGYVFYGYWDARFCLLMAFSTTVSYLAGRGFLRWTDARRRRLCLVLPIVTDLSLLAFFKYANFAVETGAGIARLLGVAAQVPHFNIVLPVGISFYTFHTITYIVDGYRGVIRPTKNFFEFSAYVSLFSQLVAGPIVRFRQIEQDLENLGHADRTRWLRTGISFFVIGLVEKVLVADTFAAFVDPAFARYATLSTLGTWAAVLGYTFQVYFDFSGYSDMAVGLGYLFGLRIPQNFNSPYKALDPSDVWRRWHISLSSCLRDYLYIPLGGSRHGEWRTYRNLMLTMLLGGLWHGASWTYIIWGGYHGALLALYRRFAPQWDALSARVRQGAMFLLFVVGLAVFRARSFEMATSLLRTMFAPTHGDRLMFSGSGVFLVTLAIAVWWSMVGPNAFEYHAGWRWRPRYAFPLAAALGACLAVMAGAGSSPFLYYQF
ncbi:MAG TPA: MBOAT family O-acyltransferase [Gemmatimonadales bacterium]|nr:MBOAT family O-acyltransferase [Gemmatimonadales bacterium]